MAKRTIHLNPIFSLLICMAAIVVPALLLEPMVHGKFYLLYPLLLMGASAALAWFFGARAAPIAGMLLTEYILVSVFAWGLADTISLFGYGAIVLADWTRIPEMTYLFYYGVIVCMVFGATVRGFGSIPVFAVAGIVIHGLFILAFPYLERLALIYIDPSSTIFLKMNPLYLLLPIGISLGVGLGFYDLLSKKRQNQKPHTSQEN